MTSQQFVYSHNVAAETYIGNSLNRDRKYDMRSLPNKLPMAPCPARVDWGAVGGPVLHDESITAAQVAALDLLLPDDDSWTPGPNVVRVGDGAFEVFAAFLVIARADVGFAVFMERALALLDDAELS